MTYLTYLGTSRENTGNGPAKKVQIFLAKTLQDIESFCKFIASNVTQFLSNGFIHYIRISYKYLAQGTFRWNGVTLLFPSLGFFYALTRKTATS